MNVMLNQPSRGVSGIDDNSRIIALMAGVSDNRQIDSLDALEIRDLAFFSFKKFYVQTINDGLSARDRLSF